MGRMSNSRTRRRGATLILFSLMIPTLIIPLVGLGMDATMLYIIQAKLSAAVDGAALGAGRLLGTSANTSEIAEEFLNANFRADNTPGFWHATNLVPDIHVTLGITKTIRINATVDVPLFFAQIFGQKTATVAASAVATKKDTRLVLVIDRSGSMNGSKTKPGVITDLKNYAQGFTQKFNPGDDELGLVVYDGSAVVGYPTVRPWDPTTTAISTGGPDTQFLSGADDDMVHQIKAIKASSGTGMAEALWLAYTELQKAHMRDLAANHSDTRLNSIVLFTDGVPSGISLYLNNPANSNAYNYLKSTCTCSNKTIQETQQDSDHMMLSWLAIPGPPFTTNSLYGMYRMASTDPDSNHTAAWWMAHAGRYADVAKPNPQSPFAGCGGIMSDTDDYGNSSVPSVLSAIPAVDRYGNATTGSGYSHSRIVDSHGNVSSIFNGTALDRTQVSKGYHWGLAIWNSVDNAAAAIRSDANLANRAGDTQNMQIQIYTIGYLGNDGVDEGLLRRIANDQASSSFDSTKPIGRYIAASDSIGLANAFNSVASSVLRLAQ